MSSILRVPVEILLDVFHANDAGDIEALQLTCRRFHTTIQPNVDALPTHLACDIVYCARRVYLYPAVYFSDDEKSTSHSGYHIAVARIGNVKTAIHKVAASPEPDYDSPLVHLMEHFPSVKRAVRLDVNYARSVLPTDVALDHFERLETIVVDSRVHYEESSFWSDLYAVKAFRRVPNFIAFNDNAYDDVYPDMDDGAIFDFITDFSLMPADKPRLVALGPFGDDCLEALRRRFNKSIASIGRQVCAIITDRNKKKHFLTNMASGSEKKALAKQLLRDAYKAQL
ncbi:hypothetical protein AAVH_26542 [Aphelenchoides avenae]|nr:hypothetical protein AAVH_37240 [Aphelenchus avenae]KAH7706228.1 hypothetical protein AAVH_26542 [Aphelenchus avenae]